IAVTTVSGAAGGVTPRRARRASRSGGFITSSPKPSSNGWIQTDGRESKQTTTSLVSGAVPDRHQERHHQKTRCGQIGRRVAHVLQRAVSPDGSDRPPQALERARGALDAALLVAARGAAHQARHGWMAEADP